MAEILMAFVISIILAVVVAFFIVKSLKAQMSNVATPGQANEYMVRDSFEIYVERDKFLYSNVVKIPRNNNNNNGGHHGGPHGGGPRGGGPRGGGPRGGGRR